MKRLTSIILIGAYLTAVFQFTVPFLSYYSNYTYFAEEACVNKHNPDLECNGKCQLEEMVQQDNHDQPTADSAIQVEKPSSSTIFFTEKNAAFHCYPGILSRLAKYLQQQSSQFISEPATPPPLA